MLSFLTHPITLIQIVALIMATLAVKDKKDPWRLFVFYLSLKLVIEMAAFAFGSTSRLPGYMYYNLLMIISTGFLTVIFIRLIFPPLSRFLLPGLFAVFIVFFLGESLMNNFAARNDNSSLLSAAVIIFYCFCFYNQASKNNAVVSQLRYPLFWITTGVLIFYAVHILLYAFYDKIAPIKLRGGYYVFDLAVTTINIILFGCWIIAFSLKRKADRQVASGV